ncbi:MAG TPA: carboxypeptidase-like regulatory domain-containing protein, partial [Pelobium sp.]
MKKRVLLDFFPKLFSKQKLMLALLLITLVFNRGYGQIVGISGTVKDETGVLLPGVAVNVKGGTMGTVTNLNGEFKLKVPANATLVFKYIGFTPQEVAVGSKTTFNIVLKEDISKLDEVVVVGYGTQAKRDVAAAINNITEKDIEQRA